MSRIRTGLGPDDWLDLGPGTGRVYGHGGRMLLAGDLVQSSVSVRVRTPEQLARRREADAKTKAEK